MTGSFLNPEEVISQLKLKSDMLAAEFGAGSGTFSILLAKRLSQGLVYAVDILEEPLSALKSRQRLEGLNNIKIVRGDLERPQGSTIPGSSLDLVVIPNVLFQAEDKNAIISEAKRVLKDGGILVIIDWLGGSPYSPKQGLVSADDIKKMAQDLKLKLESEAKAGECHYVLIFRKTSVYNY